MLLNGDDITGMAQSARVKRGIARTFQINRLFRGLSVLENVYIPVSERLGAAHSVLKPAGLRKDVVHAAMRLLDMLKLADVAEHHISELPYGRQRLVEIAIALGLASRGAAARRARRRRAERREPYYPRCHRALPKDIGVLIIEHDMDLVFRFAERITVLVAGAIFAEGTPKEIGTEPRRARGLSRTGRFSWLAR